MKIKSILGLSFLMASLLCTSTILAEENDSSTKEAVQETTVETESTQQEEKTEQTTVAIPFRQDVMEAIAEYGYGVEEQYRPESTIMVDADTGEIVFGSNIDQPWDPASISKMMTAYMAFEAMKEGKLSLNTIVTATEEDRAISTIGEISNNIIVAGVDYPIEELLYMMFYPSSNVATLMVARATGLSDTEFLDKMNAKFKEWGMENTKFNNASGAVASAFRGYYTPEGYNNNRYNQTTARDLAILAYHFLKDFPEITNFTKNPLITVMVGTPYEESFYTYNSSIPGMYQGFPGVDGFKTGSSPSAAFNHLLTAKQEDTRFIQVILGVGAWEDKDNSSFFKSQIGNGLLRKAFSEYETQTVLKAGEHTIDGVKVQLDKDIKTLVRIGEAPKYHLKEDKIVIETDLPRITSKIEPLTYPVTIIPEEVKEDKDNKQNTTAEAKSELTINFEEFLLSLSDQPILLGAIIIGLACIISAIIVCIVFILKK